MSGRVPAASPPTAEPYSPERRTALVLSGTGTAGAYHAGVLRALHEAGIKLDVVAGRGMGTVGALFAAIDGGQRLWSDKGFWRVSGVRTLYPWRVALRVIAAALGASLALVAVPIAAVAVGLMVFPIDFVLKMVGVDRAGGLVHAYLTQAEDAFAPTALPTWLPRLVLLVLGSAAIVALVDGLRTWKRPVRGATWWHMVRAPLSAREAADHCWQTLWELLRGAVKLRTPAPSELARRYTELLAENIGQPGFRELVIATHDVDAQRDLIFALVGEDRRRDLIRRSTTRAAEARRAEVFDLNGVARDYLPDAVTAALTVPLVTDWHSMTFAADGYWRGETHRLCDRPASLIRLIDELIELGAEQIVLVSAAPEAPGPHALTAPRIDGRGRLGEYVQSSEAAVVRDATTTTEGVRIFTIRPAHNPIGPFDFGTGYDDLSRRRPVMSELMSQGYEDAYHQFIEPVVGASGDRLSRKVLPAHVSATRQK
jgi:hypothetical protein